jgi:hypothetical protein
VVAWPIVTINEARESPGSCSRDRRSSATAVGAHPARVLFGGRTRPSKPPAASLQLLVRAFPDCRGPLASETIAQPLQLRAGETGSSSLFEGDAFPQSSVCDSSTCPCSIHVSVLDYRQKID